MEVETMTVEDRAKQFMDRWRGIGQHGSFGVTEDNFKAWLVQMLSDQIEDCAKEADSIAAFLKDAKVSAFGDVEYVASRIRALAESTEKTNQQEVER